MMNLSRYFFWLLFSFFCPLHALPLGNPCDSMIFQCGFLWDSEFGAFSGRIGYVEDCVFNRHLAARNGEGNIRVTEVKSSSALFVFNILDQVDIFATLGASSVTIRTPDKVFANNAFNIFDGSTGGNPLVVISTASHISSSLGLRGVIFATDSLCIGIEGQYFFTAPAVTSIYEPFDTFYVTYAEGVKLRYKEYQIGIGASYSICLTPAINLIPYIGAQFARVSVDMGDSKQHINSLITFITDHDITLVDLKNGRNFGYSIGLTLMSLKRFSLGIEGRFVNEKSFTCTVQALL